MKVYKAINKNYMDSRNEKRFAPGLIVVNEYGFHFANNLEDAVYWGQHLFPDDFSQSTEKYVEIEVNEDDLIDDPINFSLKKVKQGYVNREIRFEEVVEFRKIYIK